MSGPDPFDEALDAAIDALRRGRPVEAVLADQRPHDSALRPLLETAEALGAAPQAPYSRALAHNYAILQAAVERAQMSALREPAPAAPSPWWQRRLTFASLSLPAGALALILTAAAAGGATASIATTEVGSEVVDLVRPQWVTDMLPGGKSDDAPGQSGVPAPDANPAAPGGDAPGADNRPTAITVTGVVSNVNGNIFTLTNSDGAWLVQVDSGTEVTGEILDGADATVSGESTAEKNLHATSVAATGGAAADGNPAADRTNEPKPGNRPAAPSEQPPGGAGEQGDDDGGNQEP